MRSPSVLRLLAVACVFSALVACNDSNAPASSSTDDVITIDLAMSAGDAIAADIGFLIGAELDGMRLGLPVRGQSRGDGSQLQCSVAPDGRHVCTGVTPRGLAITRSFGFYDAAGVIQPRYHETATASVNFQMSLAGTITREGHTATVSQKRDQTLSGLAGTETQRTWNGIGTSAHNGSATGSRGSRTHVMTSSDTTANVVFKLPRVENPWPASGSMVHNMTSTVTIVGDRSGTRTVSRRAKVTFNGTAIVPLEIGDRTCSLNLQTRSVTCPTRT